MNVLSYQTGNLISFQIRKMDLKSVICKLVFDFGEFVSVHESNATVEFLLSVCLHAVISGLLPSATATSL